MGSPPGFVGGQVYTDSKCTGVQKQTRQNNSDLDLVSPCYLPGTSLNISFNPLCNAVMCYSPSFCR